MYYLWLCWVFVARRGLSLVVMSYSLFIAVHGLLIRVAFLVGSPALGPLVSVAVAQGLVAPQPLESSQIRDQTHVP